MSFLTELFDTIIERIYWRRHSHQAAKLLELAMETAHVRRRRRSLPAPPADWPMECEWEHFEIVRDDHDAIIDIRDLHKSEFSDRNPNHYRIARGPRYSPHYVLKLLEEAANGFV